MDPFTSTNKKALAVAIVATLAAGPLAGCVGADDAANTRIIIDGSSTVYPVEQAWAEDYGRQVGASISVAFSGTSAGFEKFCRGETDISGASRPIKTSEVEACTARGIIPYEIQVGIDGLAVVVHKDNDFIDHLTVSELNRMWTADKTKQANTWAEVREGWPDQKVELFGPGPDSGTFDYWIEVIIHPFDGTETNGRSDYTPSEDDNVLVQGVAGTQYGMGYFGLAYARENADKLRIVPIVQDTTDGGQTMIRDAAPVNPSDANVESGTYAPLSRPLFMYTDGKPTGVMQEWFKLGLSPEGQGLVSEVGYVKLSEPLRLANLAKVQ